MKKYTIILISIIGMMLSGCKRMTADYEMRKEGVLKVCPKCNFISNSNPYGKYNSINYYAVDTSTNPNIIYQVDFKTGGLFYSANDVDHLIRIN